MQAERTDAEQMARSRGLANGKGFRKWLHDRLPQLHEPYDWSAAVGSPKHVAMKRELDAFMGTRR